ncbi:MAG: ABC-type transporter, periplasmic subunit [Firmicutes bacterium]|nr:ABC-type transporter, periplasmic subunit [Bacillota bacterium]
MKYFLHIKLILICTAIITLISGCSLQAKQPSTDISNAGYLTIKDDAGRMVSLVHKPENIVVLSPSFLDLLYALGGKAIGRPNYNVKLDTVPAEARNIPDVGFVYNINIEKVVALQPDLVIAMQGIHDKLIPVLESNNIPVIVIKYKTYNDVFDKIALFGDIVGTQQKAQEMIQDLNQKLKFISDRLPNKSVKIAILHATAKNVTLELDTSIAGSTANILHLQNVATNSNLLESSADMAPYSLEKLVESDPDYLFVVTMGNTAEIEKTMKENIENNPAWTSLRAVRDKKVVYLPSDLFLLNPGIRMPEAVEYMARVVYPEIYANDK